MRAERSLAFAKYALADRLGMTVARLEHEMTLEEFAGWQAYAIVSDEKSKED